MPEPEADTAFGQLVQKLDPQNKLLRIWELKGGISARVTAVEVERPDGQTEKMVVRQHGEVDLREHPQVAADEFKLLQLLHAEGLPTPRAYHLDQSGEIFPTPYVVIEYIEGKSEFAPPNLADLIFQLATQLSRIHKLDGSNPNLSFLPKQEQILADRLSERPTTMNESVDAGQIRAALESVWPFPQRNQSVLLHGDYWPGNILWKDGQLVGVIDWEDAAFGDPLADLANSRLEILWAFGIDAMQRFTRQYQSMTAIDFTNLPYWDLYAALRPASKISEWAADDRTEKAMREGHRWFVTQALEKLGGSRPRLH